MGKKEQEEEFGVGVGVRVGVANGRELDGGGTMLQQGRKMFVVRIRQGGF